jgi:hypothetical protein
MEKNAKPGDIKRGSVSASRVARNGVRNPIQRNGQPTFF